MDRTEDLVNGGKLMGELSPIQLFLWIIFLEIASVPIIAFLYTWISNIRMSRNQELISNLLKAIVKVIQEHNDGKRGNDNA